MLTLKHILVGIAVSGVTYYISQNKQLKLRDIGLIALVSVITVMLLDSIVVTEKLEQSQQQLPQQLPSQQLSQQQLMNE